MPGRCRSKLIYEFSISLWCSCRSKLIYEFSISLWCSCRSKLIYEFSISLRGSRLCPCVYIVSLLYYPYLLHAAFIAHFRAELGVSGPKSYFALGTVREAHSFTHSNQLITYAGGCGIEQSVHCISESSR